MNRSLTPTKILRPRDLILAGAIGLSSVTILPVGSAIDRPWRDLVTHLRPVVVPRETPHPYLVLIAYDDAARARRGGATMPTDEILAVLDRLQQAGSGPVLLDLIFGSPEGRRTIEELRPRLTKDVHVWLPRTADVPLEFPRTFPAAVTPDEDGVLRRWPGAGAIVPIFEAWPLASELGWRVPDLVDPVFRSGGGVVPWDDFLAATDGNGRGWADALVIVADVSSAAKDWITTIDGPVSGGDTLLWQLQTALSDRPPLRSVEGWPRTASVVPLVLWGLLAWWRPRARGTTGWLVLGTTSFVVVAWGSLEGTLWPWWSWFGPMLVALVWLSLVDHRNRSRRRRLDLVRDHRARSRAGWSQTVAGLLHQMTGRAGIGVHLAQRGPEALSALVPLLEGLRDQARAGLELMGPLAVTAPPEPPARLFQRLLDQIALEHPEAHLEFSVVAEPSPLPLDPLEAELALAVFVTNAVQVAPMVRLIADRTVDGISSLTIEDDGPGLPLWFGRPRLRPGKTTKTHGNGFGLWWAQEVLADAGVRLQFRSSRRGTRVRWEWRE